MQLMYKIHTKKLFYCSVKINRVVLMLWFVCQNCGRRSWNFRLEKPEHLAGNRHIGHLGEIQRTRLPKETNSRGLALELSEGNHT